MPQSLRTRLPVIAIFVMLTGAVGLAAIGPAAGGRSEPPASRIISERSLRFIDRADGAVVALADDKPVRVFQGEQGFLRGTLRGLARMRHKAGESSQAPFRLAAWADGRLTLDDTFNGQRVDLEAFGPTNAAVFASLLPGLKTVQNTP